MIRILVIEEGQSLGGLLRCFLKWYVEEQGGALAWEAHGAEGLARTGTGARPDLVLMNVELPAEASPVAGTPPLTTVAYRFDDASRGVKREEPGQELAPEVATAIGAFLRPVGQEG